jgi:hypothetical protein
VAVGRVLWLSNGVDPVGSVPWASLVHAAPPRHPLSVRADVPCKIAGLCIGLATCVALMRLVARMRADVHHRLPDRAKASPHVSHRCGLSPICVRTCLARSPDRAKASPQA